MRLRESPVPKYHFYERDILHLYILISCVTGILLSPLVNFMDGGPASFSLVLFSKCKHMTLIFIISNYLQEIK